MCVVFSPPTILPLQCFVYMHWSWQCLCSRACNNILLLTASQADWKVYISAPKALSKKDTKGLENQRGRTRKAEDEKGEYWTWMCSRWLRHWTGGRGVAVSDPGWDSNFSHLLILSEMDPVSCRLHEWRTSDSHYLCWYQIRMVILLTANGKHWVLLLHHTFWCSQDPDDNVI